MVTLRVAGLSGRKDATEGNDAGGASESGWSSSWTGRCCRGWSKLKRVEPRRARQGGMVVASMVEVISVKLELELTLQAASWLSATPMGVEEDIWSV